MSTNLKLAITNIGDLLIKNVISQDENGRIIDKIELKIPNYQRPYKWSPKNVIQLLDDIIAARTLNKECYRVGTLILHEDKEKSYNIVDGQQRTITFSLLLKALGEKNQIDFLEEQLSSNPYTLINIPNNYRTLQRRLNNFEDNKKTELIAYIKNNCELIVVITSDISEAFQFFDSQNARGKKLYPHDLLKAYHLREMDSLNPKETESVVKMWEELPQKKLSEMFSNYLFRLKEWCQGNWAGDLNESNISKFKGIRKQDNFPYAQFYKGAYSYADSVNHSPLPFVTGTKILKPFQLNTPIVAGKPFFDYAKHYFEILTDIQNNDKYYGYFINDNNIVKTLDLRKYKNGVGNRITRLLFDTTILLYVDRFCPEHPSKIDLDLLDQFVIFAFIWAYSVRAQYKNLGWQSAQNYILGNSDKVNSFNIYKEIINAESPTSLFSILSEKIYPLSLNDLNKIVKQEDIEEHCEKNIHQNYLYYFQKNEFLLS